MFRTLFPLFFAGVLTLVCHGGASQAQAPFGQPGVPQQYQPLTTESVPQMLQAAGLAYQVPLNLSGVWNVTNPLGGPVIELYLLKSPNGQVTGLKMLSTMQLPPAGGYTKADLLKFMQKNESLQPCALCIHPVVGDLCLLNTFSNSNSNPQELKTLVTAFALIAKLHTPAWNNVGQQPFNPNPAPAPFPAPAPAPVTAAKLAGTIWTGSENLQGFGKLTFQFKAGGQAVMIDAKNTIYGNYSVNGNQVTIYLPNVATYTGTINGSTFSGQGKDNKGSWSFNVSHVK